MACVTWDPRRFARERAASGPNARRSGAPGGSRGRKISSARQAVTYRITLARQVVGIVSALAIYALLTTGFIRIGKFEPTVALVLLGAFAAGFSERLVLRALERFSAAAAGGKAVDTDARMSGRRSAR